MNQNISKDSAVLLCNSMKDFKDRQTRVTQQSKNCKHVKVAFCFT